MEDRALPDGYEHAITHAAFAPDGRSIVYMTGVAADLFAFQLQGADWWIMNVEGSDKRRLTFMNVRGHPHSVNRFRLGGSPSFISDIPNSSATS